MDQERFARYLFQGIGRPYIIAQKSPELLHQTTLLEACIHNRVYDRQCTGTRTLYLLGLIKLTSNSKFFQSEIIGTLQNPNESVDLDQLFEFAGIFARQGNTKARQVMYEQFSQNAEEINAVGAEQIIRLDGLEGFYFIAEAIGREMLLNSEYWDDDYLLDVLEKQVGVNVVAEQLAVVRKTSRPIATYLEMVESYRAKRAKQAKNRLQLEGKPYADLKSYLQEAEKQPSIVQLRKWSQSATEEDLKHAAQDLISIQNEVRLRALLYIFSHRVFPFDIMLLKEHLYNSDNIIVYRALNAISMVTSECVRTLGLELLAEKRLPGGQLRLFINNYQQGDEELFLALLRNTSSDEEVHGFIYDLNEIYKQNATAKAEVLLMEMYEIGPCSLCRTQTVQSLADINLIPEWMARECQYDADEDTQKIVEPLG